jgi:hypothetical protein
VPVALADILTQIDQHDTEPRTQTAAQTGRHSNICELLDLEKQKNHRNAAKRTGERGQKWTNAVLLQLSVLWRR